jgi:flagellar biosynthesis protein FlhG
VTWQGRGDAGGQSPAPGAPLFARRPEDQAHELRRLAAGRRAADAPARVAGDTRVIAITSGKGGVGKTSVTTNLAVTLARWGQQVIVLDCDLGTANVDVMLGMHPRYTLQHVLSRQRRLDEVMTTGPHGVRVISGGSGLHELANLSDSRREDLLATFAQLEGQADVLLLDTGAGISANVLRFVVAAGEALVVTTPEPTAVTDAYALIKVACQQARAGSFAPPHLADSVVAQANGYAGPGGNSGSTGQNGATHDSLGQLQLRLVVNQAINEAEAREAAANIAAVSRRFLGIDVPAAGFIPADRSVAQAVRAQMAVVDAYPQSPAALAIQGLARRLLAPVPAQAAAETTPTAPTAPATVAEALRRHSETPATTGRAASGEATQLAQDGHTTDSERYRSAGNRRGIGMFVQRMFAVARGRAVSS